MNLHYHQILIIIYIVDISKNHPRFMEFWTRFMEFLTFLSIFELFYLWYMDMY